MIKFKNYSSIFATKLSYIAEILGSFNNEPSRLKAIESIVNEKTTTINNWLFNKKLPQNSKKLAIADAIGVSYDYLFNDNIAIEAYSKPELYYDGSQYLVPFVDNSKIFELKNSNIFLINKRLPVMLPGFKSLIEKYGKYIYITTINTTTFEPYILADTYIAYAEKVVLENFKLVIHQNKHHGFSVKRVVKEENDIHLECFNNQKRLLTEQFNNNDIKNLLSIIFNYSI